MLNKLLQRNTINFIIAGSKIRTTVHPTPAAVEFIQGRSAVGKPVEFKPVRVNLEKGKSYSYCACGASKKQVISKHLKIIYWSNFHFLIFFVYV